MSEDPPRPPIDEQARQAAGAPAHTAGPRSRAALRHEPQVPSLEDDLAVLALLECSHQLSVHTTGYLTEALLQWALFDPTVSPDPMPPPADGLSHLQALERIAARWPAWSTTAASVAGRLAVGRIGRCLALAVQCERQPERLSDALWREDVQRMPWLAQPLPPVRYPDGSVL